jgi:hypothetical protein
MRVGQGGQAEVVREMVDPRRPVMVPEDQQPNAIEVQFMDAPVDYDTITSDRTFVVLDRAGRPLRGNIARRPDNTARWVSDDLVALRTSDYRVILVGDGDPAIMDANRRRLDGEPSQLPSGDDSEGGNFEFALQVR